MKLDEYNLTEAQFMRVFFSINEFETVDDGTSQDAHENELSSGA